MLCSKEAFVIKKPQILYHGHFKKTLERSKKGQGKDKPKRIQKSKSINYISNEKVMIIHLIVI